MYKKNFNHTRGGRRVSCAYARSGVDIPYSGKFSRHTIFADRVVGSVSRQNFR